MSENLKRLLFLSLYDNKTNKSLLKENIDILVETRQTENQAIDILKGANPEIGDDVHRATVESLKQYDGTEKKVLLPVLAKAFIDNNRTDISRLPDVQRLFATVSEMVRVNKIPVPVITNNQYVIGNKTFPNYIRFAEYIHGIEGMSKGLAQWKDKINIDTDEPPIWEGNNIKIYDGNDVGKCIHYTTGALTGKHYGFCIGQPANTMWQSYRDTNVSTFYYVVDSNRELSDPLHIVVVDVGKHNIQLTDVNNNTGHIAEYDDDVDGYFDYLHSKGVPVDKLFVNKPKTPEEEKEQKKLGQQNDSLDWFKELSFEEQSKYIGRGHLLSLDQFKYLWQFRNDKGGYHLLKQYLDIGQAIPEEQFNILVGEEE